MQILNLKTIMKGTTCSVKIIISKLIAKVDKIGQKASNFQDTCTIDHLMISLYSS